MTRYWLRALSAHLAQGASLYILTVLGVALGVASVLCIQILNLNALGAFRGSVRALGGDADLVVSGRLPSLDEGMLPAVLAAPAVEEAWPLYRVDVLVDEPGDAPPLFLEIVGADLMRPVGLTRLARDWTTEAALTRPGWVAVSPELADARGWSEGTELAVAAGDRRLRLVVGGLADFRRLAPLASRRLAVMDIAQLQDLLGRRGVISEINVKLVEGASTQEEAVRLAAALGPAVTVSPPDGRLAEAETLLGAFRLNLTALSLISLLVGLFLVHTSVRAALVRRRRELGVLRCLGVERGGVLVLVLGEVAVLGLLGVGLGLPLGYAAAAANVDVVSRTLTSVYLLQEIETLRLPAELFVLAAAVGVGGALVGAMGPALDACRREPRELLAAYTLQERGERHAVSLAAGGLALAAAAACWFVLGGRAWRPAGFVLGIALLAVQPLWAPLLVRTLCRAAPARGLGLGYSLRSLGLRLQATAFAVAALAVAVSMLVGITVMVGSFRATLVAWVESTVGADVYVSATTMGRGDGEGYLGESIVHALAARPEAGRVDRLRRVEVTAAGRRISLSGVDMSLTGGEARFAVVAGDAASAMQAAATQGAALISEPLAARTGLGPGDRLEVATPSGAAAFPVAGIYLDYGSEQGAALVDLSTLEAAFGPGPVQSVALYLRPGHDPEAVVDRIKADLAASALRVRSNRSLRGEIMEIFNQTFAITGILRAMSLLIAAAGIALTLLVVAREKVAELALYRALGAHRRQIFGVFVGKGLGISAMGLLLGSLAGAALALILVFVINRAYFGWTIRLHWPWAALAWQTVIILAVGMAAALYPALAASRTPATELSHDDVA